MAQKEFNKMSKEELTGILNSDAIATMDAKSLFELRKAVKAAGLLTVQYDNMLGIAINNRTYEEIKNSKNYTDEEKALALEARNEYNKKLRTNTEKKLYSVEEILSRAIKEDSKYNFTEMTKGELDFLMKNGIDWNKLNVDKDYKIGQVKASAVSKEKGKTEDLSEDVKKSQEFWGNFKDNKTGLSFIVTALKDAVKVEAKKEGKTVFSGVDKGNQGFDVVEKKNNVEPYKVYDLIIKKAKVTNPKAKIRIKDSVKDPVLRNKILIACAKNNMQPVGNLPEGFDFEALKNIVKDVNDVATINALAENLDNIAMVSPEVEKENVVVAEAANKNQEEKKANTVVGIIPTPVSNRTTQAEENKKNKTVVAPVILPQATQNGNNSHVAGNTAENLPAGSTNDEPQDRPTVSLKRPWWKKVRDAAIIGGIAVLGFFGVRSCQNQQKMSDDIRNMKEQMVDCDTKTEIFNQGFDEGFTRGYEAGSEDCEESKKEVVKKTPVVKKKPVVKQDPVYKRDTIQGDPVFIPGEKIYGDPVILRDTTYVTDTIHKKVIVPQPVPAPKEEVPNEPKNDEPQNTEKQYTEWVHGRYYEGYNVHKGCKNTEVAGNKKSTKKKGKNKNETDENSVRIYGSWYSVKGERL